MSEPDEIKKLKERIAELEQQLEEEREEMEWDLKAARESSAASIRKLEKELEQARSSSPVIGGEATGDAEAALQRALMAERKVAELQHELKRARESAPKMSAPSEDRVMRQRAESAEKERDELRRQNRTLERTLSEKERALSRAESKAENTAELKRQMEELRRELMQKERELSKLKLKSEQDRQVENDSEQLRKQLSEALSQLDEKNENLGLSQARVRELADEVAYLKEEKESIEKEKEELKEKVHESIENEKNNQEASSNQSELEQQVVKLEQELAKIKMASSQMLEQRERETERLKNDLSDVKSSKIKDGKRVSELEARHESLVRELSLLRAERDEAVSALRRFREGESTVVSRPGAVGRQDDDPFEESTKRVTLGKLSGTDRSLDSTQPNLPSVQSADSQSVVPGELVAEDSDDEAFPGASDSDAEKLDSDQAAGLRDGEKFTSNSTHPGEPPPVVPEEQDLPDDSTIENLQEQGRTGDDGAEPELEDAKPSEHVTEDVKDEDFEDDDTLDEQPESDNLMVEWMGEQDQEIASKPAETSQVIKPGTQAVDSSRGLPPSVKWVLVGIGGLAGVGLIIVGALYFFPRWFGTQGVELDNPNQVVNADSSLSVSAEPASSLDGGSVAVASGGDSYEVDGETLSDASEEQGSADGDDGKFPDSQESVEHKPRKLTPREKAALRAAQAHGYKLLKKRKYKLALRFLQPWVDREPDDPVLRYLYGRALFYRKKIKNARIQLEKAVELKSDYGDAWYELIGIYSKLKDKSKTRDAMEWFISVVPKNDRRARGVSASLKKLERAH